MINIEIEYPFMFFKRIAVGRVPSAWTELTEKQFIAISKLVHGETPDFHIISILTGISKDILKKLSVVQLYEVSEQINFIGKAGSSHSDFIISELPKTNLASPKDKLANITFGQFIFLDSYFRDWSMLQSETALNKFISCLYLRPEEKFNSEINPARIELIESVDINVRKAIAYNFSLVIVWLQKAYPLVFHETQADATDGSENKTAQNSAWLTIFDSLVSDDLINRDKYAELPVHSVLRYMTKKYKENARK